jgi:hypothetical protein
MVFVTTAFSGLGAISLMVPSTSVTIAVLRSFLNILRYSRLLKRYLDKI